MKPSLAQIAALVARRAGLEQARQRPWLLESRVAERRRALRCASARGYLALLEGPEGDAELQLLLEALRVGETRFFRQPAHLRALRRVALPELAERALAECRSPKIRAWSAGCATGEEPYSMGMVLLEWVAQRAETWRLEVLATDISPEALNAARAGRYTEAAVADLPAALRERHLQARNGAYQIAPQLRKLMRFEQRNLVVEPNPCDDPGYDLVFCCNVLIYLERAAQRRALARLVGALRPGGYLFLGSAESTGVPPPAVVVALSTPEGTIYQRSDAICVSDTARESASGTSVDCAKRTPRTAPPKPTPRVEIVELQGNYDDAGRLTVELRGALEQCSGALVVDLDGAAFLDPGCARVLHRAAMTLPAGGQLALVANRPGILRWIRRQPLLAALPCASSRAAALELLSPRPEVKA